MCCSPHSMASPGIFSVLLRLLKSDSLFIEMANKCTEMDAISTFFANVLSTITEHIFFSWHDENVKKCTSFYNYIRVFPFFRSLALGSASYVMSLQMTTICALLSNILCHTFDGFIIFLFLCFETPIKSSTFSPLLLCFLQSRLNI